MSGSAKAGTTAERHTCEAAGSDRLNSARSSEARVRRIFFSLDKDLHGCRQTGSDRNETPRISNGKSASDCGQASTVTYHAPDDQGMPARNPLSITVSFQA